MRLLNHLKYRDITFDIRTIFFKRNIQEIILINAFHQIIHWNMLNLFNFNINDNDLNSQNNYFFFPDSPIYLVIIKLWLGKLKVFSFCINEHFIVLITLIS